MAHNINENKRMMYVGETPWHGLGTKLNNPATAKEAIEASMLDYKIKLEELQTVSGLTIPNNFATVREDTKEVLAVVGNRYEIIQNVDCFSFFDTLVGEGQAIYHTAGALGKGERIWILAKLPKDIIIKGENVEKYLVLCNSHDGTQALSVYFTPIRVVCQNTLNASLKDKTNYVSIKHTPNYKGKIDQARQILGITVNYYNQFEQIANALVDVKLNVEQSEKYFNTLLDIKGNDEDSTRKENVKAQLIKYFEHGKGNDNPAVKHTLWTAYNAVAEYVDFARTVKGIEKDPSKRIESNIFGSGADLKGKAFDVAQAMLIKA